MARRAHVLVAPDKFKGSLTAEQAARHLAAGLREGGAEPVRLPIADGGEGTVEALVAAGFTPRTAVVHGPLGDPVRAVFALRGDTAVIELAQASGLALVPDGRSAEPLRASTRGTGELLLRALDAGARHLVLAVGGSASTDGGAGLLAALGARLLTADGGELPDGGGALRELARIDLSGLDPRLRHTAVTVACDVDNPLLGPRGAAAVFGPQKGAGPQDVAELESGLRQLVTASAVELGSRAERAARAPGAGAAGGTGYAALLHLGADFRSGIGLILEHTGFAAELARSELVVTGEGSLDEQSLHGKGPVGVAEAARAAGVPVVAVCGRLALTAEALHAAGFDRVHSLAEWEPDPQRSMAHAGRLLETVGRRIAADLLRATRTPPPPA